MSKLFKDHPAYARTMAFIEAQVLACRPSAIDLATQHVTSRGIGVKPSNFVQKVAAQVEFLERSMARRLARYYGLDSKYVGH